MVFETFFVRNSYLVVVVVVVVVKVVVVVMVVESFENPI
jgi:hypothetical protein